MWWLGAALLVAGSVIIGRREEGNEVGNAGTAGDEGSVLSQQEGFHDRSEAGSPKAEGASSDSEIGGHGESIELRRVTKAGQSGASLETEI